MINLLHPFLFAIAPAIFLWSRNFGEVPLWEVIPTLGVLSVFGGLVLVVFLFLFRVSKKAAITASVFIFITLSFGYIYDIFFFNSLINLSWRWAFIILGLVFTFIFYAISKTKKDLSVLNRVITVSMGMFILISLFQVGWYRISHYGNEVLDDIEIIDSDDTSELRDIYYIILDGYSSPKIIKEVMGFEEIDEFTGFLDDHDFYLAEQSRSNYGATALSLPSSLNMSLLKNADDHKRHFQISQNHFLQNFLKSYGYKFIHLGDNAFTFFNKYADENVNMGIFSPYQAAIWENTVFVPIGNFIGVGPITIAEKFKFFDQELLARERTLLKLDRLAEIPKTEKGPTFVFAHFLIPQPSSVFNADGSFRSKDEETKNTLTWTENYLAQVSGINKNIEKVIDRILENSELEPIIVLQGDHGFAFGLLSKDAPHLL
ncbi:MAG: hypothetical protein Q8Q89_00840, partial [bacterium]|nr:hypothetical protein [bacterium]